jgi:Anti-sigma-K factor rskA, C-terminal
MNELEKERMLDLLIAQATGDLTETEARELRELEQKFPELADDNSFELAAASFSIANLDASEPMPVALQSKILADAGKFFASEKSNESEEDYQKTFALEPPKRSIFNWLGWAVAALACVVLAFNLMNPRVERIYVMQPTPTPTPSVNQQLEQVLASSDVIKTSWTNPKNPNEVLGDVVWSDTQQKGFLRLKNFPVNDKTREQYQLWIFDANQDPKTPIDGGVFDVTASGEVIIPIDAKIKVNKPAVFAVTAEKPGGVVVSKQEKVMALAKVSA